MQPACKTASQGQPHSGRLGFELFDKVTWGQTEFDEKVAYQRAMEGELERTIKTLADVESARVHLVMPTDSVFLDRERGAKASVILKLKHNGLPKDAVLAISRLVSGAVDGLKPEDVAIIDADSDRSLGMGHEDTDAGEGEVARLTQRLISTLEPVVGANAIRASVNIDYDQDTTEQSEEKYDPSVSALLSVQRSEDNAGGAVQSGVPGTASNVPTDKKAKPADTQARETLQTSKSESAQYGVNKTVIHTVSPAGRIDRVTAALLIDDAVVKTVQGGKTTFSRRPRSQEELNKIQELAQAAIGFDCEARRHDQRAEHVVRGCGSEFGSSSRRLGGSDAEDGVGLFFNFTADFVAPAFCAWPIYLWCGRCRSRHSRATNCRLVFSRRWQPVILRR